MGFGKNNVLPSNHFRKDWQRRVKTWFDQPGRKLRRRNARKAKAATLGVRPLTLLRPAVRGQTVRYNTKLREGRGFTLGELKEAGISRKVALGLGVVVDHRRRNLSVEGKAVNIERLKAYKERLVVFPRKARKPKQGDSSVRTVFFFALGVSHAHRRGGGLLSLGISQHLQPAKPSLFHLPLFTKSLAKLRRRSGNSTHTRPFAITGLRQGLKVHARFVQRRLVAVHLIFLFVDLQPTVFYRRKRRRRPRRSDLVLVAHFTFFIALSCMRFKTWVIHGIWH
jgi:ribosomal protein L13E